VIILIFSVDIFSLFQTSKIKFLSKGRLKLRNFHSCKGHHFKPFSHRGLICKEILTLFWLHTYMIVHFILHRFHTQNKQVNKPGTKYLTWEWFVWTSMNVMTGHVELYPTFYWMMPLILFELTDNGNQHLTNKCTYKTFRMVIFFIKTDADRDVYFWWYGNSDTRFNSGGYY
jgi:hypothetical protein